MLRILSLNFSSNVSYSLYAFSSSSLFSLLPSSVSKYETIFNFLVTLWITLSLSSDILTEISYDTFFSTLTWYSFVCVKFSSEIISFSSPETLVTLACALGVCSPKTILKLHLSPSINFSSSSLSNLTSIYWDKSFASSGNSSTKSPSNVPNKKLICFAISSLSIFSSSWSSLLLKFTDLAYIPVSCSFSNICCIILYVSFEFTFPSPLQSPYTKALDSDPSLNFIVYPVPTYSLSPKILLSFDSISVILLSISFNSLTDTFFSVSILFNKIE